MWPHIIVVGGARLTVTGIDDVAVIYQSVTIVIKNPKVEFRIVLLSQETGFLHHRTWVLVASRGIIAGIVGRGMG